MPGSTALSVEEMASDRTLLSVRSVVGHFLLPVELGFQLGNTVRCFDAIADGLQPIKTKQKKTNVILQNIVPGQNKYLKLESDTKKFMSSS